jgi:arabinoxylan arabinofuranohydrolase
MKKQVYNPYLPLYEYTPDCEPHVFDGRLYVYGSHDQFGAFQFCHNSYVTWSAPLDDLSDWRYEGIILDKKEDPDSKNGKYDLYAPDCCKGPDGKFYIYYAYDWFGKIGIAVSDKPSGPFHYYGNVQYSDGTPLGRKKGDVFHFDPGIFVDDDKRVYLYSGFGTTTWFPQIKKALKPKGAYVMELEKDMKTIKSGPCKIASKANEKNNMNGVTDKSHAFFEASSMRKVGSTYYFIYSSLAGHELCYMTGKSPMGPFTYGGVIISNGDVGYNGREKKDACYPLGNNHGSIVCVKGKWYIFYHRHTNYTNTDRQDCAERIVILPDGSIPQVEMTSCGLNDGPLKGEGVYPSSICCCLKPKEGNIFYPFFALPHQKKKLRITQSTRDEETIESQYIQNISDGDLIGYKYFDLSNTKKITLTLDGKFSGKVYVRFSEFGKNEFSSDIHINGRQNVEINIPKQSNMEALYFYFEGKGKMSFHQFELN